MKLANNILSHSITQLCLANEIDHIVISPGSRNAPLTIGFTEQPGFKCFSIVDERCAAFFALGLAQQLKKTGCSSMYLWLRLAKLLPCHCRGLL
jgi:2-succinyl-5-enolpyruvyl-6-hydroxy-3-cyclohexene-1-carboxylate synthase